MDEEDEANDADARPSDWTGEDTAQEAQPVDTESAAATFPMEAVGAESDVDIDLPPWICSFNDGSSRFRSWGHKCCYRCGSKEGDLRRCARCHHH
eukprot:5647798-Amphidinium_carterae.1